MSPIAAARRYREQYLTAHDDRFWDALIEHIDDGGSISRYAALNDVRQSFLQQALDRRPQLAAQVDTLFAQRKFQRLAVAAETIERLRKLGVEIDEES